LKNRSSRLTFYFSDEAAIHTGMSAMNPSKRAEEADDHAGRVEPVKSRFDVYPLLGILLAIVLAVLAYGGLYLLLS
jgi:hypothetical protein